MLEIETKVPVPRELRAGGGGETEVMDEFATFELKYDATRNWRALTKHSSSQNNFHRGSRDTH